MQPIYPFLLALLFCISCGPDEPDPKEQLPPATQEGLNTFGCLVNGEVWVPKLSINPTIHKLGYEYNKNGYFQVYANRFFKQNGVGIRQSIDIIINNGLEKTASYKLNNPNERYAYYTDLESNCWYETTTNQTGLLEITKLDTINHIIAGTFEFTVWTDECDTIRVTHGRFDIKYQQ